MKLREVCAVRYGKDHKRLRDGSIPVYGTGGIMRYADTALYHKKSVLIPRKGTLGNLFLATEPFWTVDTLFYTEIDESLIVPEYLYYYLSSVDLAGMNVGTAVPSLTAAVLNEVDIDVRPLAEQRAIAGVLSALDAKIAVNAGIHGHLEAQCMAIYRHLFMEEPKPDWEQGVLADLGEVVGGGTPSKARPEYYTERGLAWITPKDLSVSGNKFIARGADDITEPGRRSGGARLMPPGTVLFSSRAPIGYMAVAAGELCTNQGFKSVVPKAGVGTAFVYCFLKDRLSVIDGMASGSTFREISGAAMKRVPAVIPDSHTLARFAELCAPMFGHQAFLERESACLVALRDALLPRLMSGELSAAGAVASALRCEET